MEFNLSENQVSQIAQMLYLNLDDIENYIETHQDEYNKFLEELKENTEDKDFVSNNSVWQQYTDDTICKVNIDKNKMKGSK